MSKASFLYSQYVVPWTLVLTVLCGISFKYIITLLLNERVGPGKEILQRATEGAGAA